MGNNKITHESCKEKSVIFYELNEIPEKMINYFIDKYPKSNFSKIIKRSAFFKTVVNYDYHLHPWSVWPSVHRGVSIDKHEIKFINQEKSKSNQYPPIWEILMKENKNIGIHGSLQSYPPIIKKNTRFFLPDTFAPKPNAYPKELYFLQELNLYLIDISNGKKKISLIKLIKLFKKILLSREIGVKTISILIFHYIKEKINRKNVSRRSIYQSTLTFDSFLKNLRKYKPVFSSYFTNHLAGMMHRYWKDLFPETFNDLNYKPSEFNKNSIIIAMKEADKQVGALLQYAETSNSDLLIISGMGQGSRERESYIGELQFVDFEKFKQIIFGRKIDNLNILPAMLPDICISFDNSERLNYFLKKIELITDLDSNKIFDMPYKPELNTLNLSLKLSKNLVDNNLVIISNKKYKLDQIGLRIIKRDPGTAYHIKEGSLIWYTKRDQKLINLAKTDYVPDIIEIAPSVCKLLKINIPNYMMKDSPLIKCF